MKFEPRRFTAAATATILGLAFNPLTTVEAAPADTLSGTACRAANLNQALQLAWDHVRVYNPSIWQYWVVCPAAINPEVYDDGGGAALFGPSSGTVSAWFGSSSAASAEVLCIWREIPADTTGTSVTNLGAVTLAADAALPDTASGTVDMSAFNLFMTSTLTCRIDSGTGINSYQIIYTEKL